MNRKTKATLFLALLGILTMLPGNGQAQTTNSNAVSVTLNAVVAQYIGITVSAPAVNFSLVPGTGPTAGAPVLTVTTTWSLTGAPTMRLWGSFANAATALADGGGNNIPSSNVLGSVNGGGAAAFTATGPFGGAAASLQIYSLAGATNGTRNDTLALSINLTSQPTLPAGAYTGTLSLQAQAI